MSRTSWTTRNWRSTLTYRVVLTQGAAAQLRHSPQALHGCVDAIIVMLRVDPLSSSVIYRLRIDEPYRTIVFADDAAFLTYRVHSIGHEHVVMIYAITWLGSRA